MRKWKNVVWLNEASEKGKAGWEPAIVYSEYVVYDEVPPGVIVRYSHLVILIEIPKRKRRDIV